VDAQGWATHEVPVRTVHDTPSERQMAEGEPLYPLAHVRVGATMPRVVVKGLEVVPGTRRVVVAHLLATHEVPALIVQDAPLARQTAVGEPEKPGEQVRVGFVAP